ncbi:glycosyltransferase family 2 protein [Verrucomicrobiales bacterium BCK34]|nr:glycosyltransferase family 2 protein [Verrucomicrobiales bacterium BCK34]
MELFFWIFLGITFGLILWGGTVFARLRAVPVIEAGAPKPTVKISIIIPARNEEENLSRLLPSLQCQDFAPFEVIVVNDQSEDGTAAVAEANGAKVIPGGPLPEGWLGKPWACRQGVSAASGDWFLFLDADTVLEPQGLLNIGYLSKDDQSVHSICPHHRVKAPYEQLSAYFNAIMIAGMNAFTVKGSEAAEIGLFGQAMFLSRKNYFEVGGHDAVKSEVLENFHLSRKVAEAGLNCRCYLGKGTVSMRMFPGGFPDLVAGWSKGFVSGAANTPKSALIGISCWLSGHIMAVIALTFLPQAGSAVTIAVGMLYLLSALQALVIFKRCGNYSFLTALLFPVPLFFYQAVFFRALGMKKRGTKVTWKGRDVA